MRIHRFMLIAALLLSAGGLVLTASCGDDGGSTTDIDAAVASPDAGAAADAMPADAGPAASGPCLDRPTELSRPPGDTLPCELYPPR
jgi:hypothetical protein